MHLEGSGCSDALQGCKRFSGVEVFVCDGVCGVKFVCSGDGGIETCEVPLSGFVVLVQEGLEGGQNVAGRDDCVLECIALRPRVVLVGGGHGFWV